MIRPSQLLERLSRVSSSGRFIPEIDGLRFVAIVAVLLKHLSDFMTLKVGAVPARDAVYILVSQGFFGVELFFVISGFILSLPFAEGHLGLGSRPSLSSYYRRRVVRLEPPYLINLVLLLGLLFLLRDPHLEGWPGHFLASATYLHGLIYQDTSWINSDAWSLEVEVQFYILAPLFASLFAIRSTTLRRTILVALIAVSAGGIERLDRYAHPYVFLTLLGYAHYFLVGFLLADWYLVDRPRASEKSWRWDLLGLGAWALLGLGLIKISTPRSLLLPLILIGYIAAFRGRAFNVLFRLPWVTTVGGMCYTIYLYHSAILKTVGPWTWAFNRPAWPWGLNFLAQVLIAGVPVLVLSTLLFVAIERPFMRLAGSRRRGIAPGGS